MASITEKRGSSLLSPSSIPPAADCSLPPTAQTTRKIFNGMQLSSDHRRTPSPPINGSLPTSESQKNTEVNRTWNDYAWDPMESIPKETKGKCIQAYPQKW